MDLLSALCTLMVFDIELLLIIHFPAREVQQYNSGYPGS